MSVHVTKTQVLWANRKVLQTEAIDAFLIHQKQPAFYKRAVLILAAQTHLRHTAAPLLTSTTDKNIPLRPSHLT